MSSEEARIEVEVVGMEPRGNDVVCLELNRANGGALPSWDAGAHIDLHLGDDLVRQYSLLGSGDPGSWRVGVLREDSGRGGSLHVHTQLAVGDVLTASTPRNHFELSPAAQYLFIAGGIGITPIVRMLDEAERAGSDWQLVYTGRSLATMAFADELAAKYPDRVGLYPRDERERVDLSQAIGSPRADTLVYACGPPGLLDAVVEACAGWPSTTVRMERFVPREIDAAAASETFEIMLDSTGAVADVRPEQSILEVAEALGASVISSCREGTCGTCETRVLLGEPDHRDSVLSDEEQNEGDTMMICVSRSRSPRLVLDL